MTTDETLYKLLQFTAKYYYWKHQHQKVTKYILLTLYLMLLQFLNIVIIS